MIPFAQRAQSDNRGSVSYHRLSCIHIARLMNNLVVVKNVSEIIKQVVTKIEYKFFGIRDRTG